MALIVGWISRILNILVGVLSLALALRVLLPWFRVPQGHPVMRFLTTITDPVVRPLRRTIGGAGSVWVGSGYLDLVPLAAIFVLWLAQSILLRLLAWIVAPPLWILYPGRDLERWLVGVVSLLVQIYVFLLLLRILLEWLRVSYARSLMRFLWDATEPVLAPIRKRLPTMMGLDFTPVIAVLLLAVVQMILIALIQAFF